MSKTDKDSDMGEPVKYSKERYIAEFCPKLGQNLCSHSEDGQQVESVEFVLENCDFVRVKSENFARFVLKDIEVSVEGFSFDVGFASINKKNRAGTIICELFPEANQMHHPLGIEEIEEESVFSLLAQDDITSLYIRYEDGSIEQYWTSWEDKTIGGEENLHQRSHISASGSLYLVISKDCDAIMADLKDAEASSESVLLQTQDAFAGAAEKAGITSEYDVQHFIDEMCHMER